METTSRATVLPMASRYVGTSSATAAVTDTGAGGRSKPTCAALFEQPASRRTDNAPKRNRQTRVRLGWYFIGVFRNLIVYGVTWGIINCQAGSTQMGVCVFPDKTHRVCSRAC